MIAAADREAVVAFLTRLLRLDPNAPVRLRPAPASEQEAHLSAAGLAARDIDDDLATVGAVAAWLTRRGASFAARGGRAIGRVAWRAVRGGARRLARRG